MGLMAGATSFRLMTYNVHHCRGTDGLHLPHRIAEVIHELKPDIVTLQELDVGRRRTGYVDQARLIAEYLKMDFHFFPCFEVEEEQFGNAILSRYPMNLMKASGLPTLKWKRCETRGALWAAIDFPSGPFDLLTTHLGLSFKERDLQVKAILGEEWLGLHLSRDHPTIISGDMNAFPRSSVCSQLKQKLKDAQDFKKNPESMRTWPTRFPLFRIDHIFVSDHFVVKHVEVPRSEKTRLASDHYPVIADLVLRG